MAPEGVRYVSSWVDLEFRRCFQVMEAGSEAMLKEWTDNWNDLIEFAIVPIRTSMCTAPAAKRSSGLSRVSNWRRATA